MRALKNFAVLVCLGIALVSCGKITSLNNTRWYIDDINNTVRTVARFDKDSVLTVNYVLLDKDRAVRTGIDHIRFQEEKYFYRDMGKVLTDETVEEPDIRTFVVYSTKEEMESDQNGVFVQYRFEDGNLVVDSNVCLPVDKELGEELDEKIKKNKEYTE